MGKFVRIVLLTAVALTFAMAATVWTALADTQGPGVTGVL